MELTSVHSSLTVDNQHNSLFGRQRGVPFAFWANYPYEETKINQYVVQNKKAYLVLTRYAFLLNRKKVFNIN